MSNATERAVAALAEGGLHFTAADVRCDGKFRNGRKPFDHEWIVSESGTTSTGKEWLGVSAGDFRESGGEHKATVVFKSWTGEGFTRDEAREISEARKTTKARTDAVVSEAQEAARKRGMDIWAKARKGAEHPYADAKRLPPRNVGVVGRAMLVPYYAVTGEFMSLEQILDDGSKKYLPGGKMAGSFHNVSWFKPRAEQVHIAEGWATANAWYLRKGGQVVAAGSAGNLAAVAKAIHGTFQKERDAWLADTREKVERFPYWTPCELDEPIVPEIIIVADNDWHRDDNPGRYAAHSAAAAVGGRVIDCPQGLRLPNGKPATDFWDVLIGGAA